MQARIIISFFFPVLLSLTGNIILSQSFKCGFVVTPEHIEYLKNRIRSDSCSSPPCLEKTLSITAYIVLDSLGNPNISQQDILDGIENLNEKFAPICLSFNVCEFIEIDNFQYDEVNAQENIDDEIIVKYYKPNTINMYFAQVLISESGAAVAGWAPIPPSQDYIFIRKDAVSSLVVIPHETGHFFGLIHTFNTPGELVDGSNCAVSGDFICDTEADPYPTGFPVDIDCELNGVYVDPNSDVYMPPTDNIMSYYTDCACKFTKEQYKLIAQMYLLFRTNLW